MLKHILPGVSNLVVMSTALTSAGIMIAEAGLSFLGLGNPTMISWGKMLSEAQSSGAVLFGQWWMIVAPGIGIFLSVYHLCVSDFDEEVLKSAKARTGQCKKAVEAYERHLFGRGF